MFNKKLYDAVNNIDGRHLRRYFDEDEALRKNKRNIKNHLIVRWAGAAALCLVLFGGVSAALLLGGPREEPATAVTPATEQTKAETATAESTDTVIFVNDENSVTKNTESPLPTYDLNELSNELVKLSSKIFYGKVTSVDFEITDLNDIGITEESFPKVFTVYTVTVDEYIKDIYGKNEKEIRIYSTIPRTDDKDVVPGYGKNIQKAYAELKSKAPGFRIEKTCLFPIQLGEYFDLRKGKDYFFCTYELVDGMNMLLNQSNELLKPDSSKTETIIKAYNEIKDTEDYVKPTLTNDMNVMNVDGVEIFNGLSLSTFFLTLGLPSDIISESPLAYSWILGDGSLLKVIFKYDDSIEPEKTMYFKDSLIPEETYVEEEDGKMVYKFTSSEDYENWFRYNKAIFAAIEKDGEMTVLFE